MPCCKSILWKCKKQESICAFSLILNGFWNFYLKDVYPRFCEKFFRLYAENNHFLRLLTELMKFIPYLPFSKEEKWWIPKSQDWNVVLNTLFCFTGSEENIIELQNLVDIKSKYNFEIAMKLSTSIKNQQTFYTDLNGFQVCTSWDTRRKPNKNSNYFHLSTFFLPTIQIVKRQFFSKLPLQANYYPIPRSIYVEDDDVRLTLVSAQPLDGGSLSEGEIEVSSIQESKDWVGLGKGGRSGPPSGGLEVSLPCFFMQKSCFFSLYVAIMKLKRIFRIKTSPSSIFHPPCHRGH